MYFPSFFSAFFYHEVLLLVLGAELALLSTRTMEPDNMEDYGAQSRTLEIIRSANTHPANSDGEITRSNMPPTDKKDYLGLVDIVSLAKLQLSISGPIGKSTILGSPSPLATLLLGEGGSFVVRRVPSTAFAHSLSAWDETFDKAKGFVVVKQPSVKNEEDENFGSRLYDALMELKVSWHEPLRKHPNIVHMHSFVWDIQSNNADALAPSLIMEYADLGTVHDFQDPGRLTLHSDSKLQIALDIAEGLDFLNQCGIIHGDVKCEYVPPLGHSAGWNSDFPRNIFLFRDGMRNKHQATSIRAKIGDFGKFISYPSDHSYLDYD